MARDLERLRHSALTMAGAVEEALFLATRALLGRDEAAARRVIAGDAEIDRLENAVQEECLKVLALHQPVAGDLRRVSCVLLISTDLERIGDLAVGVAERAAQLARQPAFPLPDRLEGMSARAALMVRKSLDSFVADDAAAARAVIRMDDEVDRDNRAIIAELLAAMRRSPDCVEPGLSLFSAVRHLERVADHATNVAENVVYLVDGEVLRHHPEALQ